MQLYRHVTLCIYTANTREKFYRLCVHFSVLAVAIHIPAPMAPFSISTTPTDRAESVPLFGYGSRDEDGGGAGDDDDDGNSSCHDASYSTSRYPGSKRGDCDEYVTCV